jgi:ligand-binding SRPBCC domain-containing protein
MNQAQQRTPENSITVTPDRDPKIGRIWKLVAIQHLPQPVESVFPFFSDAYNLEKLTPSFLKFKVLTPKPIDMRSGCEIKYKLKVRGIPINWKTSILDFDPPRQFVDNQDKGPYALWHHTHTFTPTEDGKGTICTDTVRYRPAGWILAPIVNKLLVQRDVANIFRYRFQRLDDIFASSTEA